MRIALLAVSALAVVGLGVYGVRHRQQVKDGVAEAGEKARSGMKSVFSRLRKPATVVEPIQI